MKKLTLACRCANSEAYRCTVSGNTSDSSDKSTTMYGAQQTQNAMKMMKRKRERWRGRVGKVCSSRGFRAICSTKASSSD